MQHAPSIRHPALLILVLALAVLVLPNVIAPGAPTIFEGYVKYANGTGIPNVTVQIHETSGAGLDNNYGTNTTDANGFYGFSWDSGVCCSNPPVIIEMLNATLPDNNYQEQTNISATHWTTNTMPDFTFTPPTPPNVTGLLDGLVAYYPFEDGTDIIAGRNLTVSGTAEEPGVIGNATNNVGGSIIYRNDTYGLKYAGGNGVITYNFWFNATYLYTNGKFLFYHEVSDSTSHAVDNNIPFFNFGSPYLQPQKTMPLVGNEGASYYLQYFSTPPVDKWHMITLIADNNGTSYYYYDGKLNGTYTTLGGTTPTDENYYLTLGGYESSVTQKPAVAYDEFGIWNRSLNQTEITQLYNHHAGFNPITNESGTPCVPSWTCDGYATCGVGNNQSCNAVTDLNTCEEAYAGNYTEFTPQTCNYCTSTWAQTLGTCTNKNQTVGYAYTNTCCAQTGLPSDCNIPANTTQACGMFQPDYNAGDLAKATISTLAEFLIALGLFAVLIAIILFARWLSKKP